MTDVQIFDKALTHFFYLGWVGNISKPSKQKKEKHKTSIVQSYSPQDLQKVIE